LVPVETAGESMSSRQMFERGHCGGGGERRRQSLGVMEAQKLFPDLAVEMLRSVNRPARWPGCSSVAEFYERRAEKTL